MRGWHYAKNPLRLFFNVTILLLCYWMPSLKLKNALYRLMGAKIAPDASIAACVTLDFFFPELIEIGDDSVIGFGSTILAHEFLVGEWRTGRTSIGKRTLVGANSTVLAGVEIGNGCVINAMTLVNKNVPDKSYAEGVPCRIGRKRKGK